MYMTVSGAPVKKARHAEPISAMALDMLQAVTLLKNPANKKPMTVTIGKMRHFHRRLRRNPIEDGAILGFSGQKSVPE